MSAAEIGSKIAASRLASTRMEDYPGSPPANVSEAYKTQDLMTAEMALPIVGWKVGATGEVARKMLNVDEPFSGPLFAPLVTPSPAKLDIDAGDLRIVEAEIGFKMQSTIEPRDAVYSRDEIAAAIATVHPVFEIVNKRLPGTLKDNVCWLIADGGVNQSFVYGEGTKFDSGLDMSVETVEVFVDGASVSTGIGSNALGNPLDVVVWLANNLSERGITLNAGDWVSTGLLCDVVILEPGSNISAHYSSLGNISLDFT